MRTSLGAVVGRAASGQQLRLQALDLGVFGGQQLLQLGDLGLRSRGRERAL